MGEHGRFPFGQPNLERHMRLPASGPVAALVVGVYPSAFHVAWSPPPELDTRPAELRRRPFIASLAVDVEPIVFWNGNEPDPDDLLDQWKQSVRFRDSWGSVRPGLNGPSGTGLVSSYLEPLGLSVDEVAMTDVVPWFFIKGGAVSQASAIERLQQFANELDIDGGDLPARPTVKRLVELACASPRRESLRAELVGADAPLVITLGQEALDAVRGVADHVAGVPLKLRNDDTYGREGSLEVDGQHLRLIPLAHPGLIRQSAKNSPWGIAHTEWARRMQ